MKAESSDSQRIISLEELVFPSLVKCVLTSPLPETLPFLPCHPPLFAKPAVTFSDGNARQDKTVVEWGPPIVVSRLTTIFKAKQTPRGEIECTVPEEVC